MTEPPADAASLEVCARACGARCCGYVTVAFPAPRAEADWDEVRWWLAHEGTMVTRDEDGWMLHVRTACRHLGPDLACRVYADRMRACAAHDPATCEHADDTPFPVTLRTEADLARWLAARGARRAAGVVRAIRRAARRRVS